MQRTGLLLLNFLAVCPFLVIQGEFQLTIVHTNDNHARIGATNVNSGHCSEEDREAGDCYAGIARRLTKINEIRAERDHVLLLDAGDQYQGTIWFTYFKGYEASHYMNKLGYDAMCLGNHEFNNGVTGLLNFLHNATFPVVSANIDVTGEPRMQDEIKPHIIKEVGGQRVGIIGYTVRELAELVNPEEIASLKMQDEIERVREEAQKLVAQGVDKIIALGHSGIALDMRLAAEVEEVDVVIGGHSHTFLFTGEPPSTELPAGDYPVVIKRGSGTKALVLQAHAFGKYLGNIDVTFDEQGDVVSWSGAPILLDSAIIEDPELAAEVDQWEAHLANFTSYTVGDTHVHLEGGRVICRNEECNLGNMICDASLRSTNDRTPEEGTWARAAAAIWNSGGIRASIEQGPINLGHILTSFPFRDTLDVLQMKGSILREVFENSVSRIDESAGRFLQTSGIRVTYDVKQPVGSRVIDLQIQCRECLIPTFERVNDDKIYTIVTNHFIFVGGDGFDMLMDGVEDRTPLGVFQEDSVRAYLAQYSPVIHGLDGRINFYTGDTEPVPSSTSFTSSSTLSAVTASLLSIAICF